MRLTVSVTNAKFLKNIVTLLHSHYNKNKHNSQSTSNELCCAYIVPKTAASFRHNPKRAEIPLKTWFLRSFFMLFHFFKVEILRISSFYALFVSPFPRSPYFYTAIARQPTISALNQASPKRRFALRIQIFSLKLLKGVDLSEFLMTQPHLHINLYFAVSTSSQSSLAASVKSSRS